MSDSLNNYTNIPISYNNWNIYNASYNQMYQIAANSTPKVNNSDFSSYHQSYNYNNRDFYSPSTFQSQNYNSYLPKAVNMTSPYTDENYPNFSFDLSANCSSGYGSSNTTYGNSPSLPFRSISNQSSNESFTSPDNFKGLSIEKKRKREGTKETQSDRQNKKSKNVKNNNLSDEMLINKIFPTTPSSIQITKPKRKYIRKSEKELYKTSKADQIANNDINVNSNQIISNQQYYPNDNNDDEINFNDFDCDDFENDIDNDLNDESEIDQSENNNQIGQKEKKKRVLNKTQRLAANQRERKRMTIMNDAFVNLRQVLPITTGRKRRKMSRLDIVFGAIEYISYLGLLKESGESVIDFESYQTKIYMNFN